MNPSDIPLWRKFRAAQNGVAAVEFALIMPLLMTLFFGLVEVSNGIQCLEDVTNMASAAADIAAQGTQVSNSDEQNIFAGVTAMLYPNSPASAQIIITSLVDNGKGGATVAWSDASSGSAHTVGETMTVPSGLIPSGGSVILAEVSYSYSSPTSKIITGPITMNRSAYSAPRQVAQIPRVS